MAITLRGRITEDRRLEVELPPDLPVGEVMIEITPDNNGFLTPATITPAEAVQRLRENLPAERWGDIGDDEDSAEYVHRMRRSEWWPVEDLQDPDK